VRVMERILGQAEPLLVPRLDPGGRDVPDRITRAACEMAQAIGAAAIVVPTLSGFTARMVARHRPPVPIIALVPDATVRRAWAFLEPYLMAADGFVFSRREHAWDGIDPIRIAARRNTSRGGEHCASAASQAIHDGLANSFRAARDEDSLVRKSVRALSDGGCCPNLCLST